LWAALADTHKLVRTVAMTEGEVSVSTGGILAPLAISGAAVTALGWRLGFVLGAVAAGAVLAGSATIPIPGEQGPRRREPRDPGLRGTHRGLPPMLVVVVAVVALEWSASFWLASYLNADVHIRLGVAVVMVSGLYAASLAGRLTASRLARQMTARRLLLTSLAVAFAGLALLLIASGTATTAAAVAITGLGIGATFPLTSSLHVETSGATSTAAVGQVMAAAAIGQLGGPLAVGAIAEYTSLRVGLVLLPVLTLLAVAALGRHVHAHRVG
jgi:predicted MFS family arabinose efflux permease